MSTSANDPRTRTATVDSPQDADSGRDPNGRFAPGNVGGPGNPFARRVAELRQIMLDCVTDKEMEIIVGELMVQAQAGKLAAIKLLFQYVLGKPAAIVEPDTLDLQEWEQYRRAPEPAAVKEVLAARMPADFACNVLRSTLPYVGNSLAEMLSESLLSPEPPDEGDDADRDGPAADHSTRPASTVADPQPGAAGTGPSANGEFRADESRQTSTPPPVVGGNAESAARNERRSPHRPCGG